MYDKITKFIIKASIQEYVHCNILIHQSQKLNKSINENNINSILDYCNEIFRTHDYDISYVNYILDENMADLIYNPRYDIFDLDDLLK